MHGNLGPFEPNVEAGMESDLQARREEQSPLVQQAVLRSTPKLLGETRPRLARGTGSVKAETSAPFSCHATAPLRRLPPSSPACRITRPSPSPSALGLARRAHWDFPMLLRSARVAKGAASSA